MVYQGKRVAVIVPAYNEELLLGQVLDTMPDFVDAVLVVDDGSVDATPEIARKYAEADDRVLHIRHDKNEGLGQSLIDGYVHARTAKYDIIAVMAGDGQMAPADLADVIEPVVSGVAEYAKGNRLLREDVMDRMPRYRFLGNSVLTLLTKFATGYWHIIDPQCGYTAISRDALARIKIENMTRGYGYNADILNMLNLQNYRVADVEVEPVYGQEQSKIKLPSYMAKTGWLLLQLFGRRLWRKYMVRQFHPLVFFYLFSFFCGAVLALPLAVRFIFMYVEHGVAPGTTLILLTFTSMMSFFSLFFGMWLDMEDNRRLIPPPPAP